MEERGREERETRCHAVAGTTARCALYNECTNPNPATNITYNNRHVSYYYGQLAMIK